MTHFGDIQRLTEEIDRQNRMIDGLQAQLNGLAEQIRLVTQPYYVYPYNERITYPAYPGTISFSTPETHANTITEPVPPIARQDGQQSFFTERGPEGSTVPGRYATPSPYPEAGRAESGHQGAPQAQVADDAAPDPPPISG